MLNEVIDDIYEAAFVSELWPKALTASSAVSQSASGAIFMFSDRASVKAMTEPHMQPLLDELLTGDTLLFSDGVQRMCSTRPGSFVAVDDFMTEEEIANDPVRERLRALGIGAHVCTAIPLPSGDLVLFVYQRWLKDGLYDQATIDRLNHLRPHLARAGLMASRLRQERADSTVSTLSRIGLPAAVVTASNRILATNALLDAMTGVFVPLAHGGLALAHAPANQLLQEAVARNRRTTAVQSIPVPQSEGQSALIVHVLPLHRLARDIFSGGDVLVVATAVTASRLVPSPTLLSSLFDLAPAEAKLAAALATGVALKEAAAEQNIRTTTARYYLEQIFRKTGTHRQGELVALVKSTLPLHRAD